MNFGPTNQWNDFSGSYSFQGIVEIESANYLEIVYPIFKKKQIATLSNKPSIFNVKTDITFSGEYVELFADSNYRGASLKLTSGIYNNSDLLKNGFDKNILSSLKIPNGWGVALYKNNNLKNQLDSFENDISSLSIYIDDNTTSLVVTSPDNDMVIGGLGDDNIHGFAGNDTLYGDIGNDTLTGGFGYDILNGGEGIDTADYSLSPNSVNVTLGNVISENVDGYATKDTIYDVENLTGSNNIDSLNGDALNNVINGLAGNDTISGNGGNDTLIGGAGNDILNGGAGVDTADYSSSPNGVSVTLNNGSLPVNNINNANFKDGFGNKDQLKDFENLTGSAFNDVLNGDGGSNLINGSTGNDAISGLDGNDTLSGLDGNDTLSGGTGDDIIDGGNGSDLYVINGFRWEIQLSWNPSERGKFTIIDNVSKRDGIDSLINVERLQFKEVIVPLFNNNMWFNPASYLSNNNDLISAFGQNNYLAAATHYIRDGYRENRQGVFG